MKQALWVGAVVIALLLGACTGPAEGDGAGAGDSPQPVLTSIEYNEARREEMPGSATVYILRPLGHIHAATKHTSNLQWRLYPAREGAAGSGQPLAKLTPHLANGKWVLDWEDPPAEPLRLTLYAEVEPDAPDHPSYQREEGKRWAVLTSALVQGTDLGTGDRTGLLTQPPADLTALQETVTQFHALTGKGDYQSAIRLLHPTSLAPDPTRGRELVLARQGQPGPALAEIVAAQTWASRKFPWCMCRVSEVTEVVIRYSDGTWTSVFAKQDDQGQWLLLWHPR